MGWLLSLINPLGKIIDGLNAAYKAKLQAQNDADRIEADKQIAFFQDQINLATQAAQSDRWWSPRSLIEYSVVAYAIKLITFDSMLSLGISGDPGTLVKGVVMLVLGFMFGSNAVSSAAGKILAIWGARGK